MSILNRYVLIVGLVVGVVGSVIVIKDDKPAKMETVFSGKPQITVPEKETLLALGETSIKATTEATRMDTSQVPATQLDVVDQNLPEPSTSDAQMPQSEVDYATVRQDEEALYEKRLDDNIMGFEERMAQEVVDPDWSLDAEKEILDKVSEWHEMSTVYNLSCGSSLCRLEMGVSGSSSATTVFEQLAYSLDWEGPLYLQVDGDAGEVVAYLGRVDE